ncbi:hypothetical protein YC2023_097295 [Brassica napus]
MSSLRLLSPQALAPAQSPSVVPVESRYCMTVYDLFVEFDSGRFLDEGGVEVPAFAAAIEQHQKRITDAILEHARQIYADRSVNVKTQVVVGDPKDKICETVENLNADLLVLGSRAYGPIKRMFLGSVSNYCTNHAHCPVVIIKPKEDTSG